MALPPFFSLFSRKRVCCDRRCDTGVCRELGEGRRKEPEAKGGGEGARGGVADALRPGQHPMHRRIDMTKRGDGCTRSRGRGTWRRHPSWGANSEDRGSGGGGGRKGSRMVRPSFRLDEIGGALGIVHFAQTGRHPNRRRRCCKQLRDRPTTRHLIPPPNQTQTSTQTGT